jgi:hypothetical protein
MNEKLELLFFRRKDKYFFMRASGTLTTHPKPAIALIHPLRYQPKSSAEPT